MPEFISNTIQLHVAKKEGENYRFLVLQRSDNVQIYPGLWQVVTGTVETGETASMTALREIYEETGLRPVEFWTIPYVAVFYDTPKDVIHASAVFGALVDNAQQVRLSSEHQNLLWLDYEECIDKLELPSHKEGTRIFYDFILRSKINKYFKNNNLK
jgi:8-oxo-dGTP pyrophosphatase MutT (NUDIX family)